TTPPSFPGRQSQPCPALSQADRHGAAIPAGTSTPNRRLSIREKRASPPPSLVSVAPHPLVDLPAADIHPREEIMQGAVCADCNTGSPPECKPGLYPGSEAFQEIATALSGHTLHHFRVHRTRRDNPDHTLPACPGRPDLF